MQNNHKKKVMQNEHEIKNKNFMWKISLLDWVQQYKNLQGDNNAISRTDNQVRQREFTWGRSQNPNERNFIMYHSLFSFLLFFFFSSCLSFVPSTFFCLFVWTNSISIVVVLNPIKRRKWRNLIYAYIVEGIVFFVHSFILSQKKEV